MMSEERLKEILDKIKDGIGKFEEYENNALLESDECEILLNYITDLQKENKILKELNVCVGCENQLPKYSMSDQVDY